MTPPAQRPPPLGAVDGLLLLSLFAGVVGYLVLLPHNLNPADEAIHLYDAKRVLNGDVIYRDYYTVITPGFMYVMAGLFWLFGTTMETARTAAAVMHGLAAALVYATCRRLAVRRPLAWGAGLAYLVVCQPAWPIVSQHWLSTLFCVLLLFLCAGRLPARPAALVAPGLALGLLISVQHHRGAFMGAGVVGWIILDHLLQRRYGRAARGASLWPPLGWFVSGTLIVCIPLGVAIIAGAGFANVWDALVIFPLFRYRAVTDSPWGGLHALTAWQGSFTFPRLLAYLPVTLLLPFGRLLWSAGRTRNEEDARTAALLLTFCLASMASIAYYPDFIHIAFIAPAFLVAAAESTEWLLRRLSAPERLLQAAVGLAMLVLIGASVVRLQHNLTRLRGAFRLSRETAFGRIDFAKPLEVEVYEKVRALVDNAPSRYLYCYPIMAHLYLMADAINPTRIGFFATAFNGPEQAADVLHHLELKKPPYVVFLPPFVPPDDPVVLWIRAHYEPIGGDGEAAKLIYRARADGP